MPRSKAVRYLLPFLFFGLYLGILLYTKFPDITQKCYSNDSFSFLYMSRFFEQRYPTPLYAILSYPIGSWLPGSDGGNLVLFLSVIPAFISSILIFLILKKQTKNKWAPWIGTASFMGCYLLFSQAIVADKYLLLAFFFTLSYFLLVYGKTKWSGVASGLGMACHYMTGGFPYIAFALTNREFRRYWYIPLITFAVVAVPYYLFVPNFEWDVTSSTGSTFVVLYHQIVSAFGVGRFSELGNGLVKVVQTLVVSFGLALIPLMAFARDINKSAPFLFLLAIPLIWIFTGGDIALRFREVVPFVPFAAVMVGMGINKLEVKHFEKVALAGSLAMLISMPFVFKGIDENPTTARQMINALDNAADGSLIVCLKLFPWEDGAYSDTCGGNVAQTVEYHNRIKGSNLIPVHIKFIVDKTPCNGRMKLINLGVSLPDKTEVYTANTIDPVNSEAWYMGVMEDLARVNPNRDVYYYRCVDIRKEKYELEKISYTSHNNSS